jgi:hypothetical protein
MRGKTSLFLFKSTVSIKGIVIVEPRLLNYYAPKKQYEITRQELSSWQGF